MTFLKNSLLSISSALVAFAAPISPALADPQGVLTRVELPVENVLAPAVGYDDNDLVQVVLRGSVPNGCYVLADARAERVAGTNTIRVKQFAFKKTAGICADAAALPDSMKFGAGFTTEATVGILEQGEYSLDYATADGSPAARKLTVAKAPVPATDSLPYAAVTQVRVRDLAKDTDDVSVTLTGMLNSTCVDIDQIQVSQVGDVLIVLPTLKMKPIRSLCLQVVTPFIRKVSLGKLSAGEHLVHVRSMHGRGLNQVVEVSKSE